jgi:pyruvate-ferredoxin/flavodoxin oxidoreductase
MPVWKPENCLQCNQCSLVCPHAVIRPYLLDKPEAENAPVGFALCEAKGAGLKDYYYKLYFYQVPYVERYAGAIIEAFRK